MTTALMQHMFCIFDAKTEFFNAPFFAPTRGAAIRSVMDTLADRDTSLSRHPADYHLYYVGIFNAATGFVEAVKPESLGTLVQYLPQEKEAPPMLKAMKGGAV